MPGSSAHARPLVLERPVWSLAALWRFAAAGLVLAAALTGVGLGLQSDGLPAGDAATFDAAASARRAWTVSVARLLSFLADLEVVALLTAVLGTGVYLRVRRWDLVWLVVAAVGGALLVTGAIKLLTDRARPEGALTTTISSSFPSGHAVRGMVVYGLVAWLVLRWARPRRLGPLDLRHVTIAVALLLAALTGLSRVWLAVHWASDVLFGYALGATWLLTTLVVTRPRRLPAADVATSTDGWAGTPPTDGPPTDEQVDADRHGRGDLGSGT
ncbi:phosphatase PAP2 family protein [Egicoccus halophilus]|uniref:Phosphatidic acid phosphatase type 2/haloperoxidase domain-containing protein n=1 Tax=Egicoccus halophilus TaxID=1670830 RepID=A0A8J3ADI5_9ACTN|nr:phosphatase PAP2 family protein [Egicoccus halophilus]GGI09654.1 hypothetical protein GCM10011354_35150 [Egicoccus halophilus]